MLSALLVVVSAAIAQDSSYRLPPPEVVRLLDAPETPSIDISPDARWMLLVEGPSMPSIAEVARPWIGLAGNRIDPALHAPHRAGYDRAIALRDLEGARERRVELPSGSRIAGVRWSHTSRAFAITIAGERGLELWVADVESAKARKLAERLNAVLGPAFTWMPDGASVIVKLVPEGRGDAPAPASVPKGPAEQETAGSTTPVRTYQDLLRNADDERLFEHYATSRIARIDLASGAAATIGPPALYDEVSPSPDGAHVLVSRLHRPFSYVHPDGRFPRTLEVWTIDGRLERGIAEVPLGENIPQEGVREGPRDVHWQASAAATLAWAEALDGGDPKRKAEWRDRWVRLAAPFDAEPREMLRLAQRAQGLQWMKSETQVLAGEYDRDRRWTRTLLFELGPMSEGGEGGDPAQPAKPSRAIDDRNVNDRYGDPGRPASVVTARGTRVVRQDGDRIYRLGAGASPEGSRPFLDRYDLRTGAAERLWRCDSGRYETVVAIARSDAQRPPAFVTSRESPSEPPNWMLRDLEGGSMKPLTRFQDPQPELRGMRQELVKYARKDGVELSATLYLPKNHVAGTRLPLVVWAYPLEFTDAGTAGQVGGSPWRFVRVRGPSHLLFLTQGYAVFDAATMPVVGDPERMNDTFVEQIVASAQAAIDKAAEMGVGDPARVGVGGHSYGAFMTAHLLAHCDLFKAGIARSGAYNRSLTPFGFQSERRTLWEAPDAYVKLSPFFVAHKLNEPILFVHGEKDANPGTFPIQSERMYQAVKGNGGTARLVFLPGESHGYQARESVLHTVAEMIDWFDRHVKNAKGGAAGAPTEASSPR